MIDIIRVRQVREEKRLLRVFSLDGRIGIARWIAWSALAVGLSLLCLAGLRMEGWATPLIVGGLLGLVTAKLLTEGVRRLHDTGMGAAAGLAPAVGVAALVVTGVARWLAEGPDLVFWLALALALAGAAFLTLRPGSPGANAFGVPPATFGLAPGAGALAPGLPIAAALVAAGLLFGLAILRWEEGIERQRAERLRDAPPHADGAATPAAARPARDPANAKLSGQIDHLLDGSGPR